MNTNMTRRALLKRAGALGGAAVIANVFPPAIVDALSLVSQSGVPPIHSQPCEPDVGDADPGDEAHKSVDHAFGARRDVVVWHGEEGKVVVDTFVQGSYPALKQRLDALSTAPVV